MRQGHAAQKEPEYAWLEKVILDVLPCALIIGSAALVILGLLGLITFH